MPLLGGEDLKGRVAIVTGGSRGIGRQCCLALAEQGVNVVIAAKSDKPQPTLPGTIFTVAEEVERLGVKALPVKVDVRSEEDVKACVDKTMEVFGRIDIMINNASALWWQYYDDTPMSKYDLINNINARGSFLFTKECLPHMRKNGANGWGHVISMSPPINPETLAGVSGRTAYYISKMGMTLTALGAAAEERQKQNNIAGNALWPLTVVESSASENFEMGNRAIWRKATVLSDSVLALVSRKPSECTGQMWVDDDLLRQLAGFTDDDFVQYRCDPNVEPPSMADLRKMGEEDFLRSKATKAKPGKAKL